MNTQEAERAFREQLPCETVVPDTSTRKIHKFERPTGLLIERHESGLTKMFLIFQTGVKSTARYQIEMLRICEK